MKVETNVIIYSINGDDTKVGEKRSLNIRNVWNKNQFVELQFGDNEKIVVHQSDLIKAIKNATDNER